MATVKLITLILALSSISVLSSSRLNSNTANSGQRRFQRATCPDGCVESNANPCKPNPCLFGGKCYLSGDHKEYHCANCPYPMGGKNCAELTCGNDCLRVGNKVFFVHYIGYHMGFSRSYSRCHADGMAMAMLKEPNVHDPVRRYLAGRNVDHYNGHYCYWIGLTRTSSAVHWKWIDGTELGPYQPWVAFPTSGYNCGSICGTTSGYNFTGDYCPSGGGSSYYYHALCEKTLPVPLN